VFSSGSSLRALPGEAGEHGRKRQPASRSGSCASVSTGGGTTTPVDGRRPGPFGEGELARACLGRPRAAAKTDAACYAMIAGLRSTQTPGEIYNRRPGRVGSETCRPRRPGGIAMVVPELRPSTRTAPCPETSRSRLEAAGPAGAPVIAEKSAGRPTCSASRATLDRYPAAAVGAVSAKRVALLPCARGRGTRRYFLARRAARRNLDAKATQPWRRDELQAIPADR